METNRATIKMKQLSKCIICDTGTNPFLRITTPLPTSQLIKLNPFVGQRLENFEKQSITIKCPGVKDCTSAALLIM